MKLNSENSERRYGRVRKKFYHSEKFGYHNLIKEDSPSDSQPYEDRIKKENDHSFIVPWQMD